VEAVGEKDPIVLKIKCDKPDGLLLIDGKIIDSFENGVLRCRSTPGWHELGVKWKGGEFSREVRIGQEDLQIIHLFAEVDVDEDSQKLATEFIEETHFREVKAFCEDDFSRPIKNRYGVTKGREYFRNVKVLPIKGIKVLRESWVRVQFQGYLQRELDGGATLMSPSATVFFSFDLDAEGKVVAKKIGHQWVYRQYMKIVKEVEVLDRDFERIRDYNSTLSSKQPNLKVIGSKSAKQKTRGFHLSLPHSESIYTLGLGLWSVCPLNRSYLTLWERKGADIEGELSLTDDARQLVVLHSNWLGDKTKIINVPEGVDLESLNYENYEEKLGL